MYELSRALAELFEKTKDIPNLFAKAEAAKGYLEALKKVRLAMIALFGLVVIAGISIASLVLLVLGAALHKQDVLPAATIFFLGVTFALFSGVGIYMIFSQKMWIRFSKIGRMIEKLHDETRMITRDVHRHP